MTSLIQDVRFGARTLWQRPAFTAVAVLTLALGIGATTAIFSVVDGVLLRPLPFADPDRLVVAWEASPRRNLPLMNVAPPNGADWRLRNRSFERLAFWRERSHTVLLGADAEQIHGAALSHEMFDLLGVSPAMGRAFTPAEDRPNGPSVAIISHGLWHRAFSGSPDVVGRTMRVDGSAVEIVGVMPEGFGFPLPVQLEGVPAPRVNDIWTPLALDLAGGQRGAHFLLALGRLRPGVDAEAAERDLVAIAAQLEQEHPATNAGWTARVVPFARQVTGDQRPALMVLSGAVGLVLLLACTNVAGLLLARGAGRTREIAIRLALGATRARVIRQLLTESVLLGLAGGAAGLLVAAWLTRTVRTLGGPMLPRLAEISLDPRALAFAAGACVLAAGLSGIAPALHLSRRRQHDPLKERGGTGATTTLQRGLVVFELALALVLLAGAALLGQSFARLVMTDPGFRAAQTVTAHVQLPTAAYANHAARSAFIERLVARLEGTPGISSAAIIDALPLADDRQGTGFSIEGEADTAAVDSANVNFAFISPAYFDAMGIPLRRGRAFDTRDRPDAEPVVIVNQAFADRYFPGRDAIGQRVRMGFNTETPRQIVGIAGDERHAALDQPAAPGVFVPYLQYGWSSRLRIVARASGATDSAVAGLRAAVREVDPALALFDVRTMERIVDDSVSRPRFSTLLLGLFAAVALLLAAIGVYGVISQIVADRSREFGLRLALGATPGDVARLVLRFGGGLAAAGIAIGLPAAFLFGRLLSSLLFGTSAGSPFTYLAVAALLGIVAVGAALLPARRATRVDPLIALRTE